jgi:tetratricopeptide (TPR) repeat protein
VGERALQEATAREAAGDMVGAVRLLEGVLAHEPASVQALLAYERVLRAQGQLAGVLPVLERLLEVEPGSALGHQLRVRVLAELDRVTELEVALEGWIRATPKLETPYREAARLWQERGDHARALRVLERGRSSLGRSEALGLELGDVAFALGDPKRAVREWERAIGPDGRGFTLVRRRLAAAPDGGARVVPGLIEALISGRSSPARQRAAVELAIVAGRAEQAERIGRKVVGSLAAGERAGFLIEVARRADGAKLPGLAYWAYGALLTVRAEQPLAVRGRLGALALELGDTAAAREHFLVIERAYESGSVERRQAVAVRIELTAHAGKVDAAVEDLGRFRREFPEAPETDRLAGELAGLLLDRGDRAAAERALLGTSGPRSGLVRGWIALHEGDLAGARAAFLTAAPGLKGAEATAAIALVTLLRRLSPAGGELLARALPLVAAGNVGEGVGLLVEEGAGLERLERAAMLEYAAGLADRAGLEAESERIRRTIVTELPETPEAPMALLVLGRSLGARAADRGEARSYLERLILEHPRSALVPQARRELDHLGDRVPQGSR